MAETKVEEIKGFRNLNPAFEALKYNNRVNEHLDNKARNLLARMHETSEKFNSVTALVNEFNVRANNVETDKKITFIDFEGSEFQELIDHLHDEGILTGQKVYKFETKNEVEAFRARLEGIQTELKNKNQEPLLLIQPILNLLELMNRIAKTFADLDEKLKEKANNIR
ncbi:MAG: hypothetical protein WCT85_04195 [Parachlamydiales bacterium]|jgi:hypothetical protein